MPENDPAQLGMKIDVPPLAAEVQALDEGVEDAVCSDQPYAPVKERRVLMQTYDYAVRQLIDMIAEGDLVLDPDYQRLYRWPDDKASRYIESIVMNIPVPVLYFAEEPDGSFSVIDGQQRLTSLFRFMRPELLAELFPGKGISELKLLDVLKLRPDLGGLRFDDFSREDRSALSKRPIRCIVVLNESDPTLKFEVFERLNTGSASLTDQEVRNSLYRGPFNDLIKQLAQNDKFRRMISLPLSQRKTMKAEELVLRFFAYKELGVDRDLTAVYSDNYTEYLNIFMGEKRGMDGAAIAAAQNLFERTVDAIFQTLGPGVAFRKPINLLFPELHGFAANLINGAVFESQMVAFARLIEAGGDVPVDARKRIYSAFADDRYSGAIIQGTSQKARAIRRNETLTAKLMGG